MRSRASWAGPSSTRPHIHGHYTFEFAWGEDRLATAKTALETRFGLLLFPERRSLDALIVDQGELPAALSLLRRTARATSRLPTGLRRTLSRALGGSLRLLSLSSGRRESVSGQENSVSGLHPLRDGSPPDFP